MAVTILVPTYNMGEYLGSLAASIAGAGMLPMLAETLFVDDGSVDATPQILEELARDPRFEGKLRVLRLEPNRGRFAARFEGAQIAKGEWILFLDSRLTVMAGIAALDELYERQGEIEQLKQHVAELSRAGAAMASETEELEKKFTRQLSEAARKIESIATAIDETGAGA